MWGAVSRLPNALATHDARRPGRGGGEFIDGLGCAICHAGLNDALTCVRRPALPDRIRLCLPPIPAARAAAHRIVPHAGLPFGRRCAASRHPGRL